MGRGGAPGLVVAGDAGAGVSRKVECRISVDLGEAVNALIVEVDAEMRAELDAATVFKANGDQSLSE